MSRITQVMIVEDNQQLAESIQLYFIIKNMMKVTGIASNSLEAIEMMATSAPDVIILDLVMPRSDGFVLLSYLNELRQENKPEVIILSSLWNDRIIRRACDMGAVYFMAKPFSIDDLHDRVIDIAEIRQGPKSRLIDSGEDADSIDQRLYASLSAFGISKQKKGYQYICESVRLVIDQPALMNRMTKELYPLVAKVYHASPVSVERAIRFAIKDAWGGEDTSRIDYAKDPLRRRPSNRKFISYLSSSVLKSLEEGGKFGRGAL